jgi:hypothetical protein
MTIGTDPWRRRETRWTGEEGGNPDHGLSLLDVQPEH